MLKLSGGRYYSSSHKKGYNKEQIATILSVDPTDLNDAIETGRLIFPGTEVKKKSKKSKKWVLNLL
mgnify:CR=1 FL=1